MADKNVKILGFMLGGILIVGCLAPAVIKADTQSTNYIIWADVFNSGGTEGSASTNYSLSDSVGEGMILSPTSTSANYGLKVGFREMYPDNYLTFSLSAGSLDLGTLSSAVARTASHTMLVDTNAAHGYSVVVSGATLAKGTDTIDAIGGTEAASNAGSEQFGINLVANTSPSVGANPSGTAPIGSVASHYGVANKFAFQTGDEIALAASLVNQTVFTVSYIANISSTSVSGAYTTSLTYAITANY